MGKSIKGVFTFILITSVFSCSKEKDTGVQTTLRGNVSDYIRGIKISGYKIVLVKSWRYCANWACGTALEEVATAYTDNKGDYSITFNYKLKPEESYSLSEQYYGIPYYPEYSSATNITAGKINTVNINAWKPVELKLNVEVLNNNNAPLNIRIEFNGDKTLNATESVYEQTLKRTYSLRTKPDSDVNIIFWYYTGSNSFPVLHQMTMPYHTTLNDVVTLNYTVDCSTF